MYRGLLLLALLVATAVASAATPKPPSTRVDNVVTEYFGRTVADPYRWLENGRLHFIETPGGELFICAQSVP